MISDNTLVAAYLRHFQEKDDDDFWAWEEVNDLISRGTLDDGWTIATALIEAAPSKDALAYVAAGPLEDLIKRHGLAAVPKIKEEARNNRRFRYALAAVWLEEETPVFNEWDSLIQEYKLDEIDPIDNTPWSEDNPIPG